VWPACDPFLCLDSFTYSVTDAQGTSNVATVYVTVANTAPVANNDVEVVTADGAVDVTVPVLGNDLDAEGDLGRPLTVAISGPPSLGVAVVNPDNTIKYELADVSFAGVIRFQYTVEDESGAVSNEAVVRVAIRVDTIEITSARFQDANGKWTVTGACSDPGNLITLYSGVSVEESERGEVVGTATCQPDNTWTYDATSTALDPDPALANFVSALSSGQGFDEAFPVSFAGQNNLPTANPDTYADLFVDGGLTVGTPGVLGNDEDADFDPLAARLSAAPTKGLLVLNADGSFTYTPDNRYDGSDLFSYIANDGKADSAPTTVTISGNVPPIALDDNYSTDLNTTLSTGLPGVLANDADVEGDSLTVSEVNGASANVGDEITLVSGALLKLESDGSFSYTPALNFTGTDSFTYIASDGTDGSNLATVTISVGVNSAPVAVDDVYSSAQNTPLVIASPGVLANDTDADRDLLTVSAVNGLSTSIGVQITLVSGSSLTVNLDGSFTYTPVLNFTGVDSFTYTANDGAVDSNTTTVTITVQDAVTVSSATYRTRQARWQIQGAVSDVDSAVRVYMCTEATCGSSSRSLIGSANVNAIDGSWNINGSGATLPDGGPAWVIAVSSTGSESNIVPVNIRN
jgi:hypothetical protein